MALFDRYINGEFEQVYKEIESLGEAAFLPSNFPDIEMVLTETFQRVSHNLHVIYAELNKRNYRFLSNPLSAPLPSTELLLQQLDNSIKPFGFVPLSLKMFYRFVGSCDFVWVNYLRICFEGCGFPKMYFIDYESEFYQFFETVKPQLKAL